MTVLGPHLFDGVPLLKALADAGVPQRAAERWLAAYTANGSTARSGWSDRARRRRIPVDLVNLIEGMALPRPPKISEVHREAARIAGERG
jgi:putative transposase